MSDVIDDCRLYAIDSDFDEIGDDRDVFNNERYEARIAPIKAAIEGMKNLVVCSEEHGGEGNTAAVYGHYASLRICLRLYGTDTWVYDPRWESK